MWACVDSLQVISLFLGKMIMFGHMVLHIHLQLVLFGHKVLHTQPLTINVRTGHMRLTWGLEIEAYAYIHIMLLDLVVLILILLCL